MLTGIACFGSMWLCELILGFHFFLFFLFLFLFLFLITSILEFSFSMFLVVGSTGKEWRKERVELCSFVCNDENGLCLVAEKAGEKKGEIKEGLKD